MKHPNHKSYLRTVSFLTILIAIGSFLSLSLLKQDKNTSALDNDVSNGIIVDSTLDTPDILIGNNICDDGAGNCTLRAAIEEANSDPDISAINFNISGTPDFTNNSQNGYTIITGSGLPTITRQVAINGYSQPGAQANSAVSPLPFNGTILIEIDFAGSNYSGSLNFRDDSDNSSVRGLSLYGLGAGAAITMLPTATNIEIQGNYIGPDATGLIANSNCVGIDGGPGALIGGLDPEDRNIISANNNCGIGSSGGVPKDSWTVQGNYIGLAADGITAMPNSSVGGAGGLTIDFVSDVTIGGSSLAARNVISGNYAMGLAPHGTLGLTIQGNFIGTDYTGLSAVPNGGAGIGAGESTNTVIGGDTPEERNVISGNNGEGIYSETDEGFILQGNYIGVGSNGTTAIPNIGQGVSLIDAIGIVGGEGSDTFNHISNNGGTGIIVSGSSSRVSILLNSIHDNNGLAIDLNNDQVTANDLLDSDTGPNSYLNYPDNLEFNEVGGIDTDLTYSLDVPAGDYKIEFYSNTVADPSGFGEGEEYLGFFTVTSSGTGPQSFTHTLAGVGIPNISATATLIDVSSDNGYGPTSEFSAIATQLPPVSDLSVSKTLINPQDIAIGATANYQITVTNSGPNDADLSGFGTVFGGSPLFFDFVPPDLIDPTGYTADGPLPGSYFLDSGNPDLTCIYVPAPGAFSFGLTTDTALGLVPCWLTGSDTILESGSSISAYLNFEVAPDSDLVFTNYVLASATDIDPDLAVLDSAFGSGDVYVYLTELQNRPNNFVASAFPIPEEPEQPGDNPNSTNGGLGQTGGNIFALLAVSLFALLLASYQLQSTHRFFKH